MNDEQIKILKFIQNEIKYKLNPVEEKPYVTLDNLKDSIEKEKYKTIKDNLNNSEYKI